MDGLALRARLLSDRIQKPSGRHGPMGVELSILKTWRAAHHRAAMETKELKRKTMTAEEFRKTALSLPETWEAAHMSHPDFRVGGKIFATLSPAGQGWAMVKLTPEQQESFVQAEPKVFSAFKWCVGTRRGHQGGAPSREEDHSARGACLRLAKQSTKTPRPRVRR